MGHHMITTNLHNATIFYWTITSEKNLLDCESDIMAKINTDHFPVIIKIKMALKTKITEKEEATKKYYKPNAEDWEKHNVEFGNRIKEMGETMNLEEIVKAIKKSRGK